MNGYVQEQHNYFAPVQQTLVKPAPEVEEVPECLRTPEAQRLWERAKAEGWVDDDLQPQGLSRSEAALLADRMRKVLGIEGWAPFEHFWHRKNMRQDFSKAYDYQKSGDFMETLKKKLRAK